MENPAPVRRFGNCTYHMVFTPKYRRKEIYGENKIGRMLRELCGWKYTGGDTAEDECDGLCRFSEREKRFDGLRALERHIVTENFGTKDTIRVKERP